MNKELKQFTITMESGTRFGGKYRDEAHVRDAYKSFSGKIAKIEQRDIWTAEEREEMDADKAWHRAY
tara:strand:+ start:2266 stop:2466 length:201 start_codon:yes stop_codon:yes gene_type:complete